MPGVREFLDTAAGKSTAGLFVLLAVAVAIYSLVGGSSEAGKANDRMFIDATTGKTFAYDLVLGDKIPIKSPSGQTGYPAEECYWTKEGGVKTTPTYVLLNAYAGKPGPTFCPDCGRLVIARNPPADASHKAPPTQAEYEQRRPAQAVSIDPAAGR